MRVLYSNVDSFLNKKDEFLIRITKEKPDIIGLTEIRAKKMRDMQQKMLSMKYPIMICFWTRSPKEV